MSKPQRKVNYASQAIQAIINAIERESKVVAGLIYKQAIDTTTSVFNSKLFMLTRGITHSICNTQT